jgi:hypothetical protein
MELNNVSVACYPMYVTILRLVVISNDVGQLGRSPGALSLASISDVDCFGNWDQCLSDLAGVVEDSSKRWCSSHGGLVFITRWFNASSSYASVV